MRCSHFMLIYMSRCYPSFLIFRGFSFITTERIFFHGEKRSRTSHHITRFIFQFLTQISCLWYHFPRCLSVCLKCAKVHLNLFLLFLYFLAIKLKFYLFVQLCDVLWRRIQFIWCVDALCKQTSTCLWLIGLYIHDLCTNYLTVCSVWIRVKKEVSRKIWLVSYVVMNNNECNVWTETLWY